MKHIRFYIAIPFATIGVLCTTVAFYIQHGTAGTCDRLEAMTTSLNGVTH